MASTDWWFEGRSSVVGGGDAETVPAYTTVSLGANREHRHGGRGRGGSLQADRPTGRKHGGGKHQGDRHNRGGKHAAPSPPPSSAAQRGGKRGGSSSRGGGRGASSHHVHHFRSSSGASSGAANFISLSGGGGGRKRKNDSGRMYQSTPPPPPSVAPRYASPLFRGVDGLSDSSETDETDEAEALADYLANLESQGESIAIDPEAAASAVVGEERALDRVTFFDDLLPSSGSGSDSESASDGDDELATDSVSVNSTPMRSPFMRPHSATDEGGLGDDDSSDSDDEMASDDDDFEDDDDDDDDSDDSLLSSDGDDSDDEADSDDEIAAHFAAYLNDMSDDGGSRRPPGVVDDANSQYRRAVERVMLGGSRGRRNEADEKAIFRAVKTGDFGALPSKNRHRRKDDDDSDQDVGRSYKKMSKKERKRMQRAEAAAKKQHKQPRLKSKKRRADDDEAALAAANINRSLNYFVTDNGIEQCVFYLLLHCFWLPFWHFFVPLEFFLCRFFHFTYHSLFVSSISLSHSHSQRCFRTEVSTLCELYGLSAQTTGGGKRRLITISRTHSTCMPPPAEVDRVLAFLGSSNDLESPAPRTPSISRTHSSHSRRGTPSSSGGGGSGRPHKARDGSYSVGAVVGAAAPMIDEENVGNRMLRMMGWSPGDGLGARSHGIVEPVSAVVRGKRTGLGLS